MAFVLAALCSGTASAADLVPIDTIGAAYTVPHERIDVGDGRRLNLFCMGTGEPTVVFESGLSDWSSTWALIQPAIAKTTRACSYDRAGMGYSDPAPGRRTPAAAVRDLQALLDGAGIRGRIVLVGHSLGGFYAKLFAATNPERVAGLVLVDPSEERKWARVGPLLAPRYGAGAVRTLARDEQAGIAELIAHFADCARDAGKGALDDARYRRCTDPVRAPLGEAILRERRVLQATAIYQQTQHDELAHSMYVADPVADAEYARLFSGNAPFGDMPLIVLTHGLFDLSEEDSEIDALSWKRAHQLSAALSRRGVQRTVPYSRHNLQVENPDVVVSAIEDVLGRLAPVRASDPDDPRR
jgi:pimeloyl-ACP methyl ester carboxylesterase